MATKTKKPLSAQKEAKKEAKAKAKAEAKALKAQSNNNNNNNNHACGEACAESCGPAFRHVAKKPLSTGKGATPADVGRSLVELFNTGRADEVKGLWHHKKIESIEADGTVFLGRKGIDEKDAWWYGANEVHSARAEGPFVGATGFAVLFHVEISPRMGPHAGRRMTMHEVGVYTVAKGKIAREEFMPLAS